MAWGWSESMGDGLRSASAGRRVVWLWPTVVLAASASCAEPVETRVRLRISAEPGVAIPGQVDLVRVGVVASHTASDSLCYPVYREFPLGGPEDLPIVVDYFPGERYTFGVAFRLEWYRGGVIVAQREMTQPFPAEGMRVLEGELPVGCFTFSCLSDQQCISDADSGQVVCAGLSGAGLFSNPALIEPGARACDNTEVVDAGGDDAGADDAGADAGDG